MLGIGGIDEVDAEPLIQGVGLPEAAVAAKVGEPGVYPHAGPGGYNECLRLTEQICRLPKFPG